MVLTMLYLCCSVRLGELHFGFAASGRIRRLEGQMHMPSATISETNSVLALYPVLPCVCASSNTVGADTESLGSSCSRKCRREFGKVRGRQCKSIRLCCLALQVALSHHPHAPAPFSFPHLLFAMAVRIRMAVHGVRNNRIFHIVAVNQRQRRNAKPIELLGVYNPRLKPGESTKTIEWSVQRIKYWLKVGATPSDTVTELLQMVCAVLYSYGALRLML